MSNTIYLYLKTHNVTGLKYLGKTTNDPFEYQGSGKHWKRHIEKHGYDVTTEILFETTCEKEFKQVGLEYSKKWNIVESDEFANLMNEQGDGGQQSDETRLKMSLAKKGKKQNPEHVKKRAESNTGIPRPGVSEKLSKYVWCNNGERNSRKPPEEVVGEWVLGRIGDVYEKVSKSNSGKKHSEERKRRISESVKESWKKRKLK